MINLGILKEEKKPFDFRTPLIPVHCKKILQTNNIKIFIQSSNIRCYSDNEYKDNGVQVVDDISFCDILMGVKEIPVEKVIPNKIYLFFSHTIKMQPYNRNLLKKIVNSNITLVDYELLSDANNDRIIGFGRYAGLVGCYNGFLTYGKKFNLFNLKPAHKCKYFNSLELKKIKLPPIKILVTGKGRVGKGVCELIDMIGVKKVNINDYLSINYDFPVYINIDFLDYYERKDGLPSSEKDFFKNTNSYKSVLKKFVNVSDIFFAGHYYDKNSPFLLSDDDMKSDAFKVKVIADISCDLNGPIPSTIRSSTILDPIYGYDPIKKKEVSFKNKNSIGIMAVDNLPCELPRDSSQGFSEILFKRVIPYFQKFISTKYNEPSFLKKATICSKNKLTERFNYLSDYIK